MTNNYVIYRKENGEILRVDNIKNDKISIGDLKEKITTYNDNIKNENKYELIIDPLMIEIMNHLLTIERLDSNEADEIRKSLRNIISELEHL